MPRRRRRRSRKKRSSKKPINPKIANSIYWVYAIQSLDERGVGKNGQKLQGYFYVGCTTNLVRRLRQHNGELVGGAKFTAKHRPWEYRAIYGPYKGRSNAMKAEYALKHGKRSTGRMKWSVKDSKWCRGLGADDPRVKTAGAEAGD